MGELKELRRSSTAACVKAGSSKFRIVPGWGRSRQSLNRPEEGGVWSGTSSRWEVLRMKAVLEGLLIAGYTLKTRKVNPVLFISLWVSVSGRPRLPF